MCSRQRGQQGLSPCGRRGHGERRTEEPVRLGCRGQGELGGEAGAGDWVQPAGLVGCCHILRTRRSLEVFGAGKWMA